MRNKYLLDNNDNLGMIFLNIGYINFSKEGEEMMDEKEELNQKLLDTVKAKRASTANYARSLESHANRLTNTSIICTAVTAVLTAGPAIGRENFTQFITGIIKVPDSAVWGTLCLLAMVLSVVAAITNNMNRSHDVASRLAKAQSAALLLEKLAISIEYKQITETEATKLYQQYLSEIPFIP
jgi:hypothetical protein